MPTTCGASRMISCDSPAWIGQILIAAPTTHAPAGAMRQREALVTTIDDRFQQEPLRSGFLSGMNRCRGKRCRGRRRPERAPFWAAPSVPSDLGIPRTGSGVHKPCTRLDVCEDAGFWVFWKLCARHEPPGDALEVGTQTSGENENDPSSKVVRAICSSKAVLVGDTGFEPVTSSV